MTRILERIGVEPWPRLFQNLRSSRETELANQFPIHVVTGWLGNSPKVAQQHYLQITEQHFAEAVAVGGATGGALSGEVVPQVVPQPAATVCNEKKQAPAEQELASHRRIIPGRSGVVFQYMS